MSAELGKPPLWHRGTESCVPQVWHCSLCEWSGDDPRTYERLNLSTGETELALRDSIPWPTCPNCGEHRFYVEDQCRG